MLVPVPSADLLKTPHYKEFQEGAADYFKDIDTQELAQGITPEDISAIRWHPSAFMVVHLTPPLVRAEGQLRLHIWPGGINRCETDIHSHPWNLASKVVMGTYVEYLPSVQLADQTGEVQWRAIGSWHEPNDPDRVHLTKDAKVAVDMGKLITYADGSVHMLPGGVYHQTPVSGSAPLITLAMMGENRYTSHYLRPLDESIPQIEQPRGVVTAEEFQQAYEIVRAAARGL